MPLGLWQEIEFDCFEVIVEPGDRLLIYSDGATECMNSQAAPFGEERLIAILKREAVRPLGAMLGALYAEIKAWRGVADFGDDLSLLAIEMT
jgi:sigma-B regulation protein RsbU (phosphoserine phosphatase)